MNNTAMQLVSLLAVICFGLSAAETSHNVWLTRIGEPTYKQSWVKINNIGLKKLKGNNNNHNKARVVSAKFEMHEDMDSDEIMCEITVLQKAGPKYVKSPFDYPKKSCCEFFKAHSKYWECIQKNSTLPRECPIKKGTYSITEVNADDCNPADVLPPNLPEDYKATCKVTRGYDELFKISGFVLLKKKMKLGFS